MSMAWIDVSFDAELVVASQVATSGDGTKYTRPHPTTWIPNEVIIPIFLPNLSTNAPPQRAPTRQPKLTTEPKSDWKFWEN